MVIMQMNIWKIIYLNRGERCEYIDDHRSYPHNSSNCTQLFTAAYVVCITAMTIYVFPVVTAMYWSVCRG